MNIVAHKPIEWCTCPSCADARATEARAALCEDCRLEPGVVWLRDRRLLCAGCAVANLPRRSAS